MEKVKIVIICYNISNLLTLQVDCIKKFCKDEWSILVVDNSSDLKIAEEIKYFASIAGCEYIKTNATSINGSASHAFAAQLSYMKVKDEEWLLYLDHDAFLMRDFSVNEVLGDNIIAGIGQTKSGKKYLWPGALVIANHKIERDLLDFAPNSEYGMDTGGNLHRIIDKYGEDHCVFFNEAYHQNPNFTKSFYNFYSMINDGMFLHLLNASNWANSNDHEERINSLINIVKEKAGV